MYPGGKRFAFTVFDDTDVATLDSIRPVYDLLYDLGFLTTKTVWPLGCATQAELTYAGSSSLRVTTVPRVPPPAKSRSFEIASHGATMETSQHDSMGSAALQLSSVFDHG